jgi:hypothetical protein
VVNGGQAVYVTAKIVGITKAKRYVKQGKVSLWMDCQREANQVPSRRASRSIHHCIVDMAHQQKRQLAIARWRVA